MGLPGWYGFGSGVRALLDERPDAAPLLQRMFREWPFFRTLVANMEMALAKTDLGIARRYAGLLADEAARERVFETIERDWQLAVDALAAITGHGKLLAGNPALARSIEHRFPYIDPLNHAQVELMRRARSGELGEEGLQAVHLTINGVAAGLRNTG